MLVDCLLIDKNRGLFIDIEAKRQRLFTGTEIRVACYGIFTIMKLQQTLATKQATLQELTYPTFGKEKSSTQKCRLLGDM